jgi:hypothetical protein
MNIQQFLREVDPDNLLINHENTDRHVVVNKNKKTLMKYFFKNTELVAYACTPDNGIVIFSTKRSLAAYSCELYTHWDKKYTISYSHVKWTRISVTNAIKQIAETPSPWTKTYYDDQVAYFDRPWPCVFKATLSLYSAVKYCSNNSSYMNTPISVLKKNASKLSNPYAHNMGLKLKIFKLKSGRLRVEVNNECYDTETLLKLVLSLKKLEDPSLNELPVFYFYSGEYKANISKPLPKKLLSKLRTQVVADKMRR